MNAQTSAPRRFAVADPGIRPVAMLAAIFGLTLLAIALVGHFTGDDEAPFAIVFSTGIFILVTALLWLGMRRRDIALDNGVLTVRAALYTRRVALSELDLDTARVVDLRERTDLKPLLRTNGFALPGFDAGHFRLRDKGPAFLLVTDRSRVLLLPVRGGTRLLLSPEQPQALLAALRELATPTPARRG